MKNIKLVPLLAVLAFAPALLCAQTAAPAQPAAKKDAAKKPAAKKDAPAKAPAAAPAAPEVKPTPPDPFNEAMAKLKSADSGQRRAGAEQLAQNRDAKGIPALLAALSDSAPRVRQAAIDALGMLSSREAAPKLSELLVKDPDASVRQQAAISLSYIRDQKSGPALLKALDDKETSVRYAALHTLGAIKYAPAEKEISGLLSSKDLNLRRGAVAALGQLQSAGAAGAIVSALKDADPYVKLEAVKALGNIGYEPAVPELVGLLDKSEQPVVRSEAALALARMNRNDGLLTAYEMAKSPEISLRNQAQNIMAAVGDDRTLQFLDELYAAETDPAEKSSLGFTRQRLAVRLKAAQK